MVKAEEIASRLQKAKRKGKGWMACCPAHDDSNPSLSIDDGDKGPVFRCFSGCDQNAVVDAVESLGFVIRKPKTNGHAYEHHEILNIGTLAAAKGLDAERISNDGCIDTPSGVGFRYFNAEGELVGTKVRKYLSGADRGFHWLAGSKPCLFGLDKLWRGIQNDSRIILCEGETDALTLWSHGFTAVALPGASMWRDEWAEHFPETSKVYVILEPDKGGLEVEAAIAKSPLKERAYFIRMAKDAKDPSALHMALDPGAFTAKLDALIAKAEPAVVFRGLKGISLKDMQPHLSGFYVVKGLIPSKGQAWVLGSPGCGKTFFCTDLALHIAHKRPFRGKRVRGGLVVYVGAENAMSVERRFHTAARHNGFTHDAPLELTPGPLDLKDTDSVQFLVDFVKASEAKHGQPCVAVFIDTLSRAGGGKEDAEHFSAVLTGMDRLRDETGSTVIVIHHLGKDTERGGRGHSSLLGGVDSEITCTEEGDNKIATITKNRDGEEGERLAFRLNRVIIGNDDDGDEVTTCVVDHLDANTIMPTKRPNGKAQAQLLTELERRVEAGDVGTWTEGDLREIAREIGQHKATARTAVLGLKQLGYFLPTIGGSKLAFTPAIPPKGGKG